MDIMHGYNITISIKVTILSNSAVSTFNIALCTYALNITALNA